MTCKKEIMGSDQLTLMGRLLFWILCFILGFAGILIILILVGFLILVLSMMW